MCTEVLVNRDKKFAAAQDMVGSALVALVSEIYLLLSDDEIDKLYLLRRLCDCGSLEITTPHKFFPSSNLSEKIKKVKSMEKLTQDIK